MLCGASRSPLLLPARSSWPPKQDAVGSASGREACVHQHSSSGQILYKDNDNFHPFSSRVTRDRATACTHPATPRTHFLPRPPQLGISLKLDQTIRVRGWPPRCPQLQWQVPSVGALPFSSPIE